ncbi:sulfate permease [Saccharomonospora sp. CUA-673]|uniref:sulfate permease n=1 Tax=Saccharomonospora sp. CUA-673 TaxID=1904969 RepID=UPI00095A35E9|nr:sulfate permease [Saccharomonospora sp. CUA-673]OLT41334.1 sulfate permease [Saccharomonospora sp. CUA-673]
MFRLIWITSIHLAGFFRCWMPTNILLDRIRTRRGLKWGVPAMLIAIPYLYGASVLVVIINDGGPGGLNVLVLVSIWSAFKILAIGPVSLVMLAKARWQEHHYRRAIEREGQRQQSPDYAQIPAMAGGAS